MRPAEILLLTLLALEAVAPSSLSAQPEEVKALRKEVEALKDEQRTLRREIEELRSLLQRQHTPLPRERPDLTIDVGGRPFKGLPGAPVTLVEFSDYQCPFCARHARETLPQIEREYINTGKVKYVLRDFPLVSIHKDAFKAAEAGHCAREQGKYWEMHGRLFASQKALGVPDLLAHAGALGLDREQFRLCLESGKYASGIRQDLADGQQAGVRGTPTFFLGPTDANRPAITAVRMIRGAQPYATFKDAIETVLAPPKQSQ